MGSNLVKLISVAHNVCWQDFYHSQNKHQQKALYRQADNHRTLWGINHCIILTLWYYFLKRLLFSYIFGKLIGMYLYVKIYTLTITYICACYYNRSHHSVLWPIISLVDELIWIKLEHLLKLSKQLVLFIIQYFVNYEMFEM